MSTVGPLEAGVKSTGLVAKDTVVPLTTVSMVPADAEYVKPERAAVAREAADRKLNVLGGGTDNRMRLNAIRKSWLKTQ
jgi:hypothetical protein